MFLPIILAVFALAGAPTGTPVSCTTAVPLAENGWAQWAPTEYILLRPDICNGLVWLSDPGLRFFIERRSPFTNWVGQAGVSALVALHEATHIAGDHDETDTECRAMTLLPGFLAQYLSGAQYEQALRTARTYDAMLPPLYHQHACS